ncbi:hypothetical protein AB6A23_11010 [Paenibacillus tarimensis]
MSLVKPIYDNYGVPLTRSGVSERIWSLYKADQEAFKREVNKYFALGYPGWTVVKASYHNRIIWLRDDRRQHVEPSNGVSSSSKTGQDKAQQADTTPVRGNKRKGRRRA